MLMIIKKKIKSTEVKFLNNNSSLYVSDFRSIGESLEYSIPAMWKYENLLPWILKNQTVTVNEDYKKISYPDKNNLIKIAKTKKPKTSIFEKIQDLKIINKKIDNLWTAIPHPAADLFCKKNEIKINYTYNDFLFRNDKILQKKLLGNLSPKWRRIDSLKQISLSDTGMIKRKHGSGGYTIFDAKEAMTDNKFIQLFNESPSDWYIEKHIPGRSFSIQCLNYTDNNNSIIWGFAEQLISQRRFFTGAHILSLSDLSANILEQLKTAIKRLKSLLENYEGFWGLDFIIDKNNNVFILEANIRLTAVTIPTLLVNNLGVKHADFHEDIAIDSVHPKAKILCYSPEDSLVDALEIKRVN